MCVCVCFIQVLLVFGYTRGGPGATRAGEGQTHLYSFFHQKLPFLDFPGDLVVKSPPGNAGHVGSTPGWGTKIPQAAEKLGTRTTTREAVCCN